VAWASGAASANNGGLYLSTNALAPTPTFTQTLVTTTANARGEIAGNNVAGTVTFYVANGEAGDGRMRRSTDGGATWSAFLAGMTDLCGGQCFYDIAVAVHPTNANIVNVGGDPDHIQARSTDGGATFTDNATTANGLHGDTHVIAMAPSIPGIYFGSDGGIYKSTDAA
jgi:hypothetical protein